MSDDQKLADEWAAALGAQNSGSDPTAAPIEEFEEDSSANKAPLSVEERKKVRFYLGYSCNHYHGSRSCQDLYP